MKTNNKTPKKPGWKPIVIDHDKVEQLAAQGLGPTQIARALGISWDTYNKNKKRSSELSEAIKRSEARGLAKVTNSLFKSANQGNVTAQIFYLKNRDQKNWADRLETNHSINLASIIGSRKQALTHSTPATLPPAKGLIINNDD